MCVWEQSIKCRRIMIKSLSSGSPWMAGGASGNVAIMFALDVVCMPDSTMVDP
jgi:phosphoribosyl-AMP cyclohydrolase